MLQRHQGPHASPSSFELQSVGEALREETRTLELLNQTGRAIGSTLDLCALRQVVTDAATSLSGAEFGVFFTRSCDAEEVFELATRSGAADRFDLVGLPREMPATAPLFAGAAVVRCGETQLYRRFADLVGGEEAAASSFRSCLAVPVTSRSGDALGWLVFGHSRPHAFTERAEQLVTGIAAQAGIAIDNARLYEAAQRAAAERQLLLESERSARTAAERMSEMKDAFLANLSHELRTPLHAILGWSQVLRTARTSAEDLARGLETIERNARIQTKMIEDLLDVSRITSGKLTVDLQAINPAASVESAIDTVRHAADAKGVRLDAGVDPNAGLVAGDSGRLQQVVSNLLSNAVKFTPRGGAVHVQLRRRDDCIDITVSDTGVGIDPELIPRLFERFKQGDASITRKHGGLGLGLSIVRHLIELHGGTVDVTSEGEGRGTTATVSLPRLALGRLASGRGHGGVPPYSSPPADLSGVKVLVVDDQEDARELVSRLLEDAHASVVAAECAADALTLVQMERPDLLVSDIGMPDVDGYELLRRVRALGAANGGRVPAIGLTAFARPEDRLRVLEAGFVVHVPKPVDPAELVATVAAVIRRAMADA